MNGVVQGVSGLFQDVSEGVFKVYKPVSELYHDGFNKLDMEKLADVAKTGIGELGLNSITGVKQLIDKAGEGAIASLNFKSKDPSQPVLMFKRKLNKGPLEERINLGDSLNHTLDYSFEEVDVNNQSESAVSTTEANASTVLVNTVRPGENGSSSEDKKIVSKLCEVFDMAPENRQDIMYSSIGDFTSKSIITSELQIHESDYDHPKSILNSMQIYEKELMTDANNVVSVERLSNQIETTDRSDPNSDRNIQSSNISGSLHALPRDEQQGLSESQTPQHFPRPFSLNLRHGALLARSRSSGHDSDDDDLSDVHSDSDFDNANDSFINESLISSPNNIASQHQETSENERGKLALNASMDIDSQSYNSLNRNHRNSSKPSPSISTKAVKNAYKQATSILESIQKYNGNNKSR